MLPIIIAPSTIVGLIGGIGSLFGAGGGKNRAALNDKIKEVNRYFQGVPFEQWPQQLREGYVKLLEARHKLEPASHSTWPFKHWLPNQARAIQRDYERHRYIHARRVKEEAQEEQRRREQEEQQRQEKAAKLAKFDSSFKNPEIPKPLSTLGETDPKLAKAMESDPQGWLVAIPSPEVFLRMQMRGAGDMPKIEDDQTPTWRGFDEIKPRETDVPQVSHETPKRNVGRLPYYMDPLAQFLDKQKKER
jgi:hypothetical protein